MAKSLCMAGRPRTMFFLQGIHALEKCWNKCAYLLQKATLKSDKIWRTSVAANCMRWDYKRFVWPLYLSRYLSSRTKKYAFALNGHKTSIRCNQPAVFWTSFLGQPFHMGTLNPSTMTNTALEIWCKMCDICLKICPAWPLLNLVAISKSQLHLPQCNAAPQSPDHTPITRFRTSWPDYKLCGRRKTNYIAKLHCQRQKPTSQVK